MATSYTSNKKIGALDSASTPLAATNEIVINQNGDILKTPLSAVEAKVFDAKTSVTNPSGTEVVVVRQTDNALRQVALSDIVPALNITNAKVSASAAIEDTKLATINTAGKVTNQAVQATDANTANRIVARDGSGNFAAGTITASLSGNASTATVANAWATARDLSLTGDVTATLSAVNGSGNVSAAATIANDAVTTTKILNANVTTAKIADANVTTAKIADANVTTAKIADSNVTTAKIANDAVTTAKILNANVTAAKIADANVTTSKIADANVTTAKIADANVTTAKLAAATQQSLVPAGAVMPFAMNSAPSGWLAADGTAVGRSTYAALFAAIGTTHGVGDGSTTFNLPDLRGYFVRGSGANSDGTTSGTFAAKQGSSMLNHTHSGTTSSNGDHTHGNNSSAGITGVYVNWPGQNNLAFGSGSGAKAANFPVATGGAHTHTLTTGNPSAGGGTETRPANIALLYCIKF